LEISRIRPSTHRETAGAGDLVLDALVDSRAQVAQEGALLGEQQAGRGSILVGMCPQRGGVHQRGLGGGHQGRDVPDEGALDAQQLLRLDGVRLVEDDARLVLTPLQLVENGLRLGTHIQLGRVVDQKDDVRPIDEPLAGVVEGEDSGHLLAHL